MLPPQRVLHWTYIGRLSLATAIFVAALVRWPALDALARATATAILLGAVAFTALSVWYGRTHAERAGRGFHYAQMVFDLLVVSAVVHITEGAASQFAALYILVTVSASLLLPVGGGLLIAALGNALYFADSFWGHEALPNAAVLLQLGVFAAVALGTAYLSARLREAGTIKESELEQQLVLVKLQADDILRHIRSGIVTSDVDGRLLYANPAAGALLGFDSTVVIGQPIRQVLAAAPVLIEALARGVAARERITRGEAAITIGGRSVAIGLTTTTIDLNGTPAGVSTTAIFQDISANKRLEELRLRAERLEGVAELSASLAHEIRNPLASIRSAVEQLAQAPRATDDERVLGALIVRESDRLSRLLAEFLDFARTNVTRLAPVDLRDVAHAAARLVAMHPDCKAGVSVTCGSPDEPVMVEGDEDLLHRAVFNIALNAVQATPERGEVRLSVTSAGAQDLARGMPFDHDAVAVRVTDSGAGIPAGLRDRIFDPFFTTKAGGTGLGLPIAHRAIEAHRGVMLLDSGARGTSCTVILPRWQRKQEDAA